MKLESHQFIRLFESDRARELCEIAVIANYPAQKVIFEEGEVPDYLYLVLDGEIEFRKRADFDRYQRVAVAHPNDFFGEFGILDGQPRSAQAIASHHSKVAKIPRSRLMEILQQTPGSVVLDLFGYIVKHLRVTTEEYVKQLVYKDKMVLVGEMMSTVIHDLKSPLSGINLSSEMLKVMHPDEDTAEWCDMIHAQAHRMVIMVEELLEFSRVGTVLNKQPLHLAIALQRFYTLNQVYLEQSNVKFLIESTDVVVNVDESKLLRVLQNLVVNAIEAFNDEGGCIKITTEIAESQVIIQVHDNGSGIPEAIRDRFFEPYVTYGKRSGTGLGTVIAKSIVDAHGGTIDFESNDKGTTFFITLPR